MRQLLLILLFCLPAVAQFTTVTGTVIDPNGIPYANGTIVPTLVSSGTPTLNGLAYSPPSGPVGLNISGSFTMNLANQASLSPGGTTWSFNVCSASGTVQPAGGTGPQCFVITGVVIAGASQSISAQLQAAAKALTIPTAGSSAASSIVLSGLLAQYDFNQGSGTVLSDVSGNGNNGALCAAGAAPTWVASTGGLSFNSASSQCVTLPASLNSALTIEMFVGYTQEHYDNTTFYPAPIAGNGVAANSNSITLQQASTGTGFANAGGFQSVHIGSKNDNVEWRGSAQGNLLISLVMDASADAMYFNSNALTVTFGPSGSAGRQTSGVYQFGGRGAGFINGNSSFWTGTIYYALFYNRKLTATEVAQNSVAVSSLMASRGIPTFNGNAFANGNLWVIDGDSLPGVAGSWMQYTFPITTYGGLQGVYVGTGGYGIQTILATSPQYAVDDYLSNINSTTSSTGAQRILNVQIGTNNLGSAIGPLFEQYADYVRQRKAAGWQKVIVNTVPDKTGADAGKNTFNTMMRTNWRQFADGLIDLGADPNLGCDGCSLNTQFFNVDGIHPVAVGQYEFGFIMEKVINHILGNNDFSTANTYTTTAPAATAITAASETTNTVTITFAATPASFVPGVDLTITGVTPAGYNTSSSNVCHVLTRTATQITCLNPTTGLGAGTVFGTASTPTQQDQDVYTILGGSATTPNFTLQSCLGSTGNNIYIKNSNTTSPWTITPWQAETIDGAASLTMPTATSGNNPVVTLQSVLVSSSAGGCTWKRLS